MSEDITSMLMGLEDIGDESRNTYIRAPFSYTGSKFDSLQRILPKLPYTKHFVEVFGGSGVVLLNRRESPLEVFNDRFSGVTSFYRVVRDKKLCQELIDRLELTCHSREEFVWCANTWKNFEDDVERAARWWYSILSSFAQGGRAWGRDRKGSGKMGRRLHNKFKDFQPVHERLINVQIENLSWQLLVKDYDSKDTVFYMDPPYYKTDNRNYEYNVDHVELLERVFKLDGFVAISTYPNDLYNKYPWDELEEWTVQERALGMAFTESNNLGDRTVDDVVRSRVKEQLYIKRAVK